MNMLRHGAEALLQAVTETWARKNKIDKKVYRKSSPNSKVFQNFLYHSMYQRFKFSAKQKSFPKENILKKGESFLGYEKCFAYGTAKYLPESLAGIGNLCKFANEKPRFQSKKADFPNGNKHFPPASSRERPPTLVSPSVKQVGRALFFSGFTNCPVAISELSLPAPPSHSIFKPKRSIRKDRPRPPGSNRSTAARPIVSAKLSTKNSLPFITIPP